MKILDLKLAATATVLTFLSAFAAPFGSAQAQSIPITDQPLFTTSGVPPLMMMVMSRDEQLYIKAYTDYTDLDGDGVLDATYNNGFAYSGYFDANVCYAYNNGQFKATAAASNHKCSSAWSGNFLNWVTMSRLDMLRYVLYGGKRSTDTSTKTVLERAAIPNDLHAWVKIYSGGDIASYTPFSGTVSFCNATFSGSSDPIMRVAQGNFTEWSATADSQCNWRDTANQADNPPSSQGLGSKNYTVRVEVCGGGTVPRESFCRRYTHPTTGAESYKPAGLLQEYGESGQMRFGLMTGSYANPRSGGRLRRNIGRFAGNGTSTATCATGDEVKLSDGTFCNQGDGVEGIINTLSRLKLVGWTGNSNGSGSGWKGGVAGAANDDNCYEWGGRARGGVTFVWKMDNPGGGNRHCSAWGNPLSELYAEAVRYIIGGSNTATAGFVDGNDTNYLPGVPDKIGWIDPYGAAGSNRQGGIGGGNPYCASCSILVLSTGLNSFDSDEIPSVSQLGDAAASTKAVGETEGITGDYLVGRVLGQNGSPASLTVGADVNTASDICSSKTVADLSKVIGICPDIPSLEGSYLMDGLAYKAWTTDLRPSLTTPKGKPKPATSWNQVQTYTVALAENLPSFAIKAGSLNMSFSPLCQSNTSGNVQVTGANWVSCSLGSVKVGEKTATVSPNYVYGRPLLSDNSAGSYSFTWEDSPYGSDRDLDATQVVTWCVGRQACSYQSPQTVAGKRKNIDGSVFKGYDICWRSKSSVCGTNGTPSVADGDVLVRSEITSTAGGYSMMAGYNISGAGTADGPQKAVLATNAGGTGGGMGSNSLLTGSENPGTNWGWGLPDVRKFTAGGSGAKRLQNPLWYAAKYGGFTKPDAANPGARRNPRANEKPQAGDWEALDDSGSPTTDPANYFLVRDPSRLKEQLQKVFDSVVAGGSPSGSVAASGARFTVGQTLAYQSSYDSKNWVGDLKAFSLNSNGSLGSFEWSAASNLPSGARDTIWVGVPGDDGRIRAQKFTQSNLTTGMSDALAAGGSWPNDTTSIQNIVAYLSGDQRNEEPSGPYRKRDTAKRLGDIVNSSPQVAYKISYGYNMLQPSTGCDEDCIGSYQDHVDAKPTTVFVGANDGMLHAFSGAADGGEELFAYIPNAVVPKLGKLAKPKYTHTFFVDGTPALGDAYLGEWKTILVSSAGAGARTVFALDVTDPASFSSNSLLFEFNDQADPDMGQFTGIPSPPTLTADGKWVTAFGNGYNGASNVAKLFVINLADGSQITTDAITDAANAAPNGLSTATIIDAKGTCPATGEDVCSDGIGDTIYAGDYRGNVWKFVLSGNRWRLSPSTPIFKAVDGAGHRQPITSGMYAIKNPLGGAIIYFGTGKYLTTTDNDPDHLEADDQRLVNSLYAIWDNGSGTPVTRSDLQEQKITAYNDTTGAWTMTQIAFGYRSENYPAPQGKMGWYLDLSVAGADPDPLSGERIVASPVGLLSRLFVNVFRPIGDICLPAGVNSLLELDLLNGSAAFPSDARGFGGSGNEAGTGLGGRNIGEGPPLSSPNPVVTIPGQTGIPAIGCPDTDPNCVPTPPSWCTPDVPGYPKCADPVWCQPSTPGYPNCPAPPDCHPASGGLPASPGYPYCKQNSQCSLIPNAGTPVGNQNFQCRASWRQLR